MLNLLASIWEFERDLLKERIKSWIAHARSNGTKTDRTIARPAFDKTQRTLRLLAEAKSIRAIESKLPTSKTTVMKIKFATSGAC